jgi:hypothetical protein
VATATPNMPRYRTATPTLATEPMPTQAASGTQELGLTRILMIALLIICFGGFIIAITILIGIIRSRTQPTADAPQPNEP